MNMFYMFYKGGICLFFSLLLEVPDRIGESSGKNDGEIFISINYNILLEVKNWKTFYFT